MACIGALLSVLLVSQTGATPSEAERRVFGNPSVRATVDARTRSLYEAASRPEAVRRFLFTRKNLLDVADAFGTDASSVAAPPAGTRLLATVWSKRGKYMVEYYRSAEGRLLFVYETFVYFAERPPSGAWRNFMSQPAWERRSYFGDDGSIAYAESQGDQAPAPGEGAEQLGGQAERLAKAVEER